MALLVATIPLARADTEPADKPATNEAAGVAMDTEVPITQAVRIRALPNSANGPTFITQPVRLEGFVTFVHRSRQTFFLEDSSGGVMVTLSDERIPLPAAGDRILLVGTTAPGARRAGVRANAITKLSATELPKARVCSYAEATSGEFDDEWVEIEGTLKKMEQLDGWARLTLETTAGPFTVSIPSVQRPAIPVDAVVRVRGVCSTWLVGGSNRIGGFFLFTPSISDVRTIQQASSPAGTLTAVDQVLALRRDDAIAGQRVNLRGVVTFVHPDQRYFYLDDRARGVLIHLGDDALPLPKVSQFAEVTGTTTMGVLLPSVRASTLSTGANLPIPVPRAVSLEQALTGSEDGRWVEMRGHLRQIEVTGNWLRLTVTAAAGDFQASIPNATTTDLKAGAFLRVRGVCVPWIDDKAQIGGVFLCTPTLRNVEITEAPPEDPFNSREETIANLQQYRTEVLEQKKVRIRGKVLHQALGRYVVVENASGVIRALSHSTTPLRVGQEIDVVGVPGRQGNRSLLRAADFRVVADGRPPIPKELLESTVVDSSWEDRLVTFEGQLLEISVHGQTTRLLVQTGKSLREIEYSGVVPEEIHEEWQPGAQVSVTGLCHLRYEDDDLTPQVSATLRSLDDLQILAKPSWWTARHAMTCLEVIGTFLGVGLVWLLVLRRQVRRQTEVIRRQVEDEASLKARQGEIIQNASDCIFTLDLSGKLTSLNPAGERMTGYSQAEAVDLHLRNLIAEDDVTGPAALLSLATSDHETAAARFETRFRAKEGRLFWVETSARLFTEHGRAAGILGIARDVTERKEIEENLRRARAAAEATTQAKSAFLANMSHEIRTPLSGVIGMSNLLLDTPLRPDQREFADTIHSSAQALLTILNDILDFSKIEAGKLQMEHAEFDLMSPIEDSIGLMAAKATAKKIQLASDVDPDLPRQVRGDAGRLRQVLLNLVGNAVKFTEAGEVVMTVSRERETNHEIALRFEVTDTGIGMSEEIAQSLFQPFTQADATTTRRFGGTGLGLAISKQIVTLMGGTIGVKSQIGRGSTFWFTVVLEKQSGVAPSAGTTESLAGTRVLAVDDHAINRRIVSHYLSAWKIRCDTTSSGEEARRMAEAALTAGDPYRLIILDYDMPVLDGIAVATQFQSNAALADTPLMLLSSVDHRLSPKELAAIGFRRVLTKPIRVDDLKRALLRLLGSTPDIDSSVPHPPTRTEPLKPTWTRPSLSLIVAEDNLVNQRIILMQLQKLGLRADMAGSGHDLLAAMERKSYQVVLMDCQMPEMDGYEATRRIRSDPRFSGVRIIAMTANAMQGDREKCLAVGMDDYLVKPTRLEDVRAALDRATNSTEITSAAAK